MADEEAQDEGFQDDSFAEEAHADDDSFDNPPAEESATAAASESGSEMFGDVVGERAPRAPKVTSTEAEDGQLRESVAGIYDMVKDLEVQLNHMISINEAAERDLEGARKAQRQVERERDNLQHKLEAIERDVQSSGELREELRHMTRENERLIEEVRKAQLEAKQWQSRGEASKSDADKTLAERNDLRDEVNCLEDQMAATTSYVETLRQQLDGLNRHAQQQAHRSELIEQRLHVVSAERDALKQELNESRSALEEIKRSLMDTNVHSQLSYYES